MSAEKDLVLRYVEAFNRGDVDAVCALFAPDAQIWGVLGHGTPDVARPLWQELMAGLEPKLQVEGIVQEGKVVVVRYKETGRSVKAFRGMGPTGKTYELTAMEWFEVEGGNIQKRWGARDSASQSRQLGFPG